MSGESEGSGPIGRGTHVVQQGECVFSIAARLGLEWETIWNHSANQRLREKRGSPAALLPNDLLTLPDKPAPTLTLTAKSENTFKAPQQVRLRLKLVRGTEVLASKRVVVTIGEREPIETSTDGDGLLDVGVPATITRLWVAVGDDGELGFYDVGIGWLDPVTTTTGVQARLRNLALYFGPIGPTATPLYSNAIRKFQGLAGLTRTGQMNRETEDALRERHGS
ncbi:MAG: hypothetical protein U0414_07285 [Polyangiaceae bacterium]